MERLGTLGEYLKRGLRVLLLDGYARQVLPVAEYLNRLGAIPVTLNTSRLDVGYVSRWPHQRHLGPDPRRDLPGVLGKTRALLETGAFDVVIPASDDTATMLAENKLELSRFAAIAVSDLTVFVRARDKLLTMRACDELGLPHPRTLDASLPELPDRVRALGFDTPLVIKPRKGSGATGFKRVDRLADLPGLVRDATDKFGPMLVQEYIPQTDLQYKTEIMLDRQGEVCSCVRFNKLRWFPPNGGASVLSQTVQRPDIDETSVQLLRGIGWRGYGDVDLIQDPRDGVAKVIEVNPRVTGCIKICFDAGVDFARQIMEDALDLPVTVYPSYEVGRFLRYIHADILWFLLSPDRWRARPSWFDFRRTTDQIFSFQDPLPGITYSLQAFGKLVGWRKKRSFGK
jgi:D-aspartate ligase